MASPNVSQAVTATLQEIAPSIHMDIINNNALLSHIKTKSVRGGRYLVHNVSYAENESFMWYSEWEELSNQEAEIITAAEFYRKMCSVGIQMSGTEEMENAGESEILDLGLVKVQNATQTMKNKLGTALYADGTGSGGKEIGGLQHIISDTPSSGTVGGIDASIWEFWRNIAYDATTDGGAPATSSNIQSFMDAVFVQIYRDQDGQRPTLIVADNNYFNLYKQSLQTIQRITRDSSSGGRVGSIGVGLEFNGAPVYLDGGIGGACPTNHMYFINGDHLCLQTDSSRNFTTVGGERVPTQYDGMIQYQFWAGNITCGSRKTQGVLKD